MLNRKPRLIVSKCLGFDHCRYSNTICKSKVVDMVKRHIDVIPVCPEQDIGLPTPRESLRIIKNGESYVLRQPKTGRDLTLLMEEYSDELLNTHKKIDGFILKGRSPSCGIKDVKVYNEDGNAEREKTSGLFANKCINRYPELPIEDEGRLTNYKIRDLFLTKLYCISEFKNLKEKNDIDELWKFHKYNELLFKLYNKSAYKEMNRILDKEKEKIFSLYEIQINRIFQRRFRKDSFKKNAESIFHEMRAKLTEKERLFLDETLEDFNNELASEQMIEYILKNNLLRFNMSHYYKQSLFNRYPKVLFTPSDSGK